MVKHLGDLHGEVQALGGLEADVVGGTVAQEAANTTQTLAEVAAPGDAQEGLQGAGLAAAEARAQRPNAAVTASHHGQETVQRVTEQAGQKECSTKVSGKEEKRDKDASI